MTVGGLFIPGPNSVSAAGYLSTDRRMKAKLTGVDKRIFTIEYFDKSLRSGC